MEKLVADVLLVKHVLVEFYLVSRILQTLERSFLKKDKHTRGRLKL